MERFRSFFNIESGEELPAFLLFIYLTLALVSYTIARTVRDSLFLNQYGAIDLPYVYIGVAVIISLVVSLYVKLASRLNQGNLISATLLFFVANIFLIWWLEQIQWMAISAVFYVWCSIFGVIITAQVWTLAGMILNTRQARRLFALIGSGGILGSFLGGLLAAVIVRFSGTDNLLLILAAFPAACIVIVQILSRRFCRRGFPDKLQVPGGSIKGERNLAAIVRTIHESRYLRLIVALLALSAVVTLIIDFQFKSVVQESFKSKDQLTAFFGSFYAWLGFFSFVLQITAGRWIVERYGIRITLLVLPIALLSGTLILLAFPIRLWSSLLLKGSDGAIRYSIDKSTIELLYVPIPEEIKAEVKAVIDMVVQRVADGLGGLVLLVFTRILGLGISGTGVFNAMLLGIWIWTACRARKEHVSFLRANLSERRIEPELALRAAFLDKDSIDRIRAMLEEKDEEAVLYGIELAVAIGREDIVPPSLARHLSRAVRFKAVEIVSLTDAEFQKRLKEETDPAIRARILSRGCSVVGAAGAFSSRAEYLSSTDVRLRMAAVSCLALSAPAQDVNTVNGYLAKAIGDLDESSEEWNYVAEAIGEIQHPAAVDLHIRLIAHPRRSVRNRAILSAGRSGHRELVPVLVRLLASRETSNAARLALREFNGRILGTLSDIFVDSYEDIEIRRQLPLVLAHIPMQRTVNVLIQALSDDDGLLRFRAIRALNRLRIDGRKLRFDADTIGARVEAEGEKALWYEHALTILYNKKESTDLLHQLLGEKIEQGRERVFRLLGLILPPEAAHAAYKAIVEQDRSKKANAAEYLDSVLSSQLKKWVLPLIGAKKIVFTDRMPEVIDAFLRSKDRVLRECTLNALEKNHWSRPVPAGGAPT